MSRSKRNWMENVDSFNPMKLVSEKSGRGVPMVGSCVNILDATGEALVLKEDNQTRDFSSIFFMKKTLPVYEIHILSRDSSSKRTVSSNVSKLLTLRRSRNLDDDHTLMMEFIDFSILVQFEHPSFFVYFENLFVNILKMKKIAEQRLIRGGDSGVVSPLSSPHDPNTPTHHQQQHPFSQNNDTNKKKKRKKTSFRNDYSYYYFHRLLKTSPYKKNKNRRKSKKKLVNISNQSIDNRGGDDDHFYEVRADNWTESQFSRFLRHVLVQPYEDFHKKKKKKKKKKKNNSMRRKKRGKIITLHEYLQVTDLFDPLIQFISQGHNYCHLKFEIEHYLRDGKKCHTYLSEVLDDELVRTALKQQVQLLEENSSFFPMSYYIVLQKRLRKIIYSSEDTEEVRNSFSIFNVDDEEEYFEKKFVDSYVLSLRQVETDLLIRRRYLWDKKYLLDTLLCLLFHHLGIEEFIQSLADEFQTFEKRKLMKQHLRSESDLKLSKMDSIKDLQKFKNSYSSDDDDDTSDENEGEIDDVDSSSSSEEEEISDYYYDNERGGGMKKSKSSAFLGVIPPDEWLLLLKDYNRTKRINLESLHFGTNMKKKRIELSFEFEKQLASLSKREADLSSQLRRKEEQTKEAKERYLKMKEKVEERKQQQNNNNNNSKFSETMNRTLNLFKEKYITLEKEYENFEQNTYTRQKSMIRKEKQSVEDGYRLDLRKQSSIHQNSSEAQITFINSLSRRTLIHQILSRELDQRSRAGLTEFVTKLVLSTTTTRRKSKKKKKFIKSIDPFLKSKNPQFFQMGDNNNNNLHSYILVSSLGLHWFENDLIFLSNSTKQQPIGDVLEEFIALDLFCPNLIVSQDTILEELEQLADEIISANQNMMYYHNKKEKQEDGMMMNNNNNTNYLYKYYEKMENEQRKNKKLQMIRKKLMQRKKGFFSFYSSLSVDSTTTTSHEKSPDPSDNSHDDLLISTESNNEQQQQEEEEEEEKKIVSEGNSDLFLGGGGKMNSQQYSINLSCTMGSTPFFPEVGQYLRLMDRIIVNNNSTEQNNNKIEPRRLRFFILDFTNGSERLKDLWIKIDPFLRSNYKVYQYRYLHRNEFVVPNDDDDDNNNEDLEEEEDKTISFRSHYDLDVFFEHVLAIDKWFHIHHPGCFQLLKGFDRAFWMRFGRTLTFQNNYGTRRRRRKRRKRKKIIRGEELEDIEILAPSKDGCPFITKF